MSMSDLLTVTGLSVHYGGIQAVRDVSFSVKAGEQTTLIGANGAGKAPPSAPLPGWNPLAARLFSTVNRFVDAKRSRCCAKGW
jgi:branched-chain amino acid transport system ATP-binding protein